MKLRWTSPALGDLEAIADYIGKDNRKAAATLLNDIQKLADRLTEYPTLGRAGRVADTREAVLAGTSYTLVYKVDGATLSIIAVLHHAREWPKKH